MPVVREHLSISQFAELVGIAPQRFNGVEVDRRRSRVTLVLEPEDDTPINRILAARQAAGVFQRLSMSDDSIVPPPSSVTVEHEHTARLYTADGRPLVRPAGFTRPEVQATQTSGTLPALTKGGKRVGGKSGKGGKRGC